MVMVQTFIYLTVGIVSIRNEKANPRTATNATCVVRTADAIKDPPRVTLTPGSGEVEYEPLVTRDLDANTLESVFYLRQGLYIGETITCAIHLKDGQVISRKATALLYDLPVLSRSPQLHPTSFSRRYFSFHIYRWNPSEGDTGDGPVIRYSIKSCQFSESQQCDIEDGGSYRTLMEVPAFTTDLTPVSIMKEFVPGANYSFIYLANRAGMYGSASPPLHVQMPCKNPLTGPTIHDHNYTMTALPATKKVNVTFTWQLPTADKLQCNYISEVYIKLSSDRDEVLQSVVAGIVTSYSIQLDAYTLYTVLVSYSNDAGLPSAVDVLYMNRTLPALPDAPEMSQVHMHNTTSAWVYWTGPLSPNGKIASYQVLYKGAATEDYTIGCTVYTAASNSCLISGLLLNNLYNFTARAVNSVGFGENSSVWEYKAMLTDGYQPACIQTQSCVKYDGLPASSAHLML